MIKSLNTPGLYKTRDCYKAILELDKKLTDAGIPHELLYLMDGYKIAYPNQEECTLDVIEYYGSYGHELDLMEGYLGPFDDVEGHMTVEYAFEVFRDWHEKN